jgi:hypothetical protein
MRVDRYSSQRPSTDIGVRRGRWRPPRITAREWSKAFGNVCVKRLLAWPGY